MSFILASHRAKGKTIHYADALAPQDVISSLPGKDTILSRMSFHTKHTNVLAFRHIPGGQGHCAEPVALLHPATDQSKSFWERMGEFEGEGEDFLKKVFPFPLNTYLPQIVPSGGPCQRRHSWWDSPS